VPTARVEEVMKQTTKLAAGSQKVRRDVVGGKRGDGHERDERISRPSARSIRRGRADAALTGVAGLVPFGVYLEKIGVDRQLRGAFFGLKDGPMVVYPMETQMRMLIDAYAVGEQRVFGLESLAADPLFVKLAGGVVPSIDTVYRDLMRFDEMENTKLELIMASNGLATLARLKSKQQYVHVDIDTTVEPLFGQQEGALPGYNPRYPGRNSYHPILAVIAETGACVGARLRPGDVGLGGDDAELIQTYVKRVVAHAPSGRIVVARIDSGGDCAEILSALDDSGAYFIVKAHLTPDICGALLQVSEWETVEEDAVGAPLVQVCELEFQRAAWQETGKSYRVVAVRRRDRDTGKQVQLWEHLDYTVQVFITNNRHTAAEDIVADYDGRAEVEPRIAELKNGIGIGKVPSRDFNANHAAFLLKLLTHNLVRRYVADMKSELSTWRMQWICRALFRVPGRLTRSGRQVTLHVPPHCALHDLLC
jgi:hypothetical protein